MKVEALSLVAVAAAVFVSAVAQVWVVHMNRVSFIDLQSLEAARDEMNIEWGRLQIEQAAWSTHSRIEQVASEQLGMRLPRPEEVVIVTR